MTVKENNGEFQCHYGHRFLGKEVRLVPFRNESRTLLGKVMYVVTEDGEYFTGGRPKEGYFLACPHCNIVQIGGFVRPGDKQLDPSKVATEKRNIALHL